jgi:hypothetical protein
VNLAVVHEILVSAPDGADYGRRWALCLNAAVRDVGETVCTSDGPAGSAEELFQEC